jgi:low affinity Fe/Cu permease
MDSRIVWIVAIAVAVVIAYFVVMRVFFRQSKELDQKIDYSKMKKWKDED